MWIPRVIVFFEDWNFGDSSEFRVSKIFYGVMLGKYAMGPYCCLVKLIPYHCNLMLKAYEF